MLDAPIQFVLRHLRKRLGASPAGEPSDGQLLERFAAGREEAAFESLLHRHAPLVLGVCRRMLSSGHDIEDVFQATFLVLVRRAAALDRRRPLAPWLYTVAYHLALRVRADDARRRRAEREAPAMSAAADEELIWRDLRLVLDEEVNRLAEKYRLPVVLCWLEGKTHEEAARELGWPCGTVAGRLARARELLRGRLLRRGITLSAGALTANLAASAPTAPAALLQSTLRGALAGSLSAPVASLAEEALRLLAKTGWRKVWVLVWAAGILGGGAVLAHRVPSGGPPAEAVSAANAPVPPEKPATPAPVVAEWRLYGGNASRSAQAAGGLPVCDAPWQRPTARYEQTRHWLDKAIERMRSKKNPILPAFAPITVNGLTIFRSYWGIGAVRSKDGEVRWQSPGQWTLDRTLNPDAEARKLQAMGRWLLSCLDKRRRPELLFQNSAMGTLSTDGHFVYAVEDLVIPPDGDPGDYSAEIEDAIRHSRLRAFELKTNGKLVWELGEDEKGPLSDCYFLGPPLPLEGKLYLLNQKDSDRRGDLRLACLGFPDAPMNRGAVLEWQVKLTAVPAMNITPLRRMQALHIAAAGDLLICPTHAGSVIAVDRRTHKVEWTYTYRDAKAAAAAPGSEWMVTAPIIHDGKVVFTAPDGEGVYCVNLQTGAEIWKAARDDDLYLGGVSSGSVVLAGPRRCRALGLADGKGRWRIETGLPSGQGAFRAGRYYLPLQSAAASGKPEICVLDIAEGTVRKHLRLPGDAVPGNLVFAEGILLSQGVTSLIGYVQAKEK